MGNLNAKSNSWYEKRDQLTVGVNGSVPKLLMMSDEVQSHSRCMYWPPGMSSSQFFHEPVEGNEQVRLSKSCDLDTFRE